MTQHEEDRPFIRPGRAASNAATQPPVETLSTTGTPLFLDPELHSSVLRLHEPTGVSSEDAANVPSPPSTLSRSRRRTGLAAGLVVLVAAVTLTVSQLSNPPTSAQEEVSVQHMPTRPSVAWSAPAGYACGSGGDEHHMILSDMDRVWSLDLRTGRTLWSEKIPSFPSEVTCLPGAGLVAIKNVENLGKVRNIIFLNPMDGAVVDTVPGSSAVDVIPLGDNVGLLGPDNALSMVRPDALDSFVWTHPLPRFPELPGVEQRPHRIMAFPLDDDTVEVLSWQEEALGDPYEQFVTILSLADGTVPPWGEGATDSSMFDVTPGGVVLRRGAYEHPEELTALDQKGRRLWSMSYGEPTIVGGRLFVTTRGDDAEEARLEQVDPRTGKTVGHTVFTGDVGGVVPVGPTHLAILGEDSIALLDADLGALGTADMAKGEMWFFIPGTDQVFLGVNSDSDDASGAIRVTALSAGDLSVMWTFDLEPRQQLEQMGSHLVITDDTGTLQGIWSSSE